MITIKMYGYGIGIPKLVFKTVLSYGKWRIVPQSCAFRNDHPVSVQPIRSEWPH